MSCSAATPPILVTNSRRVGSACPDRCAAARAPYLDREVMELVLPGPARSKVRGLSTKAILKEAARGLVPREVINRRKRGLSVPVARWLNTSLAPLADRLLDTPLLAEHRTGRCNHARRLWPQLMLALWSERWGVDLS